MSVSSLIDGYVRLVGEPAAAFGRGEQLGERGVEGGRLLGGDVVTGARDDEQRGRRHSALEKNAAVEAKVVLVADDDQQRDLEALEIRLHLPQRRALELQVEHGHRMAVRGVLGEHAGEFGVAARVLVLEGLAHRRVGVFGGGARDILLGEHLAGLGGHAPSWPRAWRYRASSPSRSRRRRARCSAADSASRHAARYRRPSSGRPRAPCRS